MRKRIVEKPEELELTDYENEMIDIAYNSSRKKLVVPSPHIAILMIKKLCTKLMKDKDDIRIAIVYPAEQWEEYFFELGFFGIKNLFNEPYDEAKQNIFLMSENEIYSRMNEVYDVYITCFGFNVDNPNLIDTNLDAFRYKHGHEAKVYEFSTLFYLNFFEEMCSLCFHMKDARLRLMHLLGYDDIDSMDSLLENNNVKIVNQLLDRYLLIDKEALDKDNLEKKIVLEFFDDKKEMLDETLASIKNTMNDYKDGDVKIVLIEETEEYKEKSINYIIKKLKEMGYKKKEIAVLIDSYNAHNHISYYDHIKYQYSEGYKYRRKYKTRIIITNWQQVETLYFLKDKITDMYPRNQHGPYENILLNFYQILLANRLLGRNEAKLHYYLPKDWDVLTEYTYNPEVFKEKIDKLENFMPKTFNNYIKLLRDTLDIYDKVIEKRKGEEDEE